MSLSIIITFLYLFIHRCFDFLTVLVYGLCFYKVKEGIILVSREGKVIETVEDPKS
jgi:hypothetical protein